MLELLFGLALLGVLVWLITSFLPMPAQFQKLIIAVAIIFALLWVLRGFGVMPAFHGARW